MLAGGDSSFASWPKRVQSSGWTRLSFSDHVFTKGSLDTTGTVNEEATIFSKDSLRFIYIMHSIESKLT